MYAAPAPQRLPRSKATTNRVVAGEDGGAEHLDTDAEHMRLLEGRFSPQFVDCLTITLESAGADGMAEESVTVAEKMQIGKQGTRSVRLCSGKRNGWFGEWRRAFLVQAPGGWMVRDTHVGWWGRGK